VFVENTAYYDGFSLSPSSTSLRYPGRRTCDRHLPVLGDRQVFELSIADTGLLDAVDDERSGTIWIEMPRGRRSPRLVENPSGYFYWCGPIGGCVEESLSQGTMERTNGTTEQPTLRFAFRFPSLELQGEATFLPQQAPVE